MEGEDGDPKKASVLGWIHFLTQGPGEEGWYLVGAGRSEGRTSNRAYPVLYVFRNSGLGTMCWFCNPIPTTGPWVALPTTDGFIDMQWVCFTHLLTVSNCRKLATVVVRGRYR